MTPDLIELMRRIDAEAAALAAKPDAEPRLHLALMLLAELR